MYLERSEVTKQNVVVLIMEDYLSSTYLDSRTEDINTMKFQKHNSTQSHIRVYHNDNGVPVIDGEEVGIVYGSTKGASKLVTATGNGTLLEKNQISMTNQIFDWETETYNEVTKELKLEHDSRNKDQPRGSSDMSITSKDACRSSRHEDSHENDRNDQGSGACDTDDTSQGYVRYNPTDGSQKIDTCVIQLGTSPYEHHADNGDDICDDSYFPSSHGAMPVMTHCITFKVDNAKKKITTTSQNVDVTIRHGVPGNTAKGSDHNMCSILGHFSGGCRIKWKSWKSKHNLKGIPMGGRSHAHMQGRGSQLRLHHWISSVSSNLRVVSSGRSTLKFQDSKQKRKRLRDTVSNVTHPSHHDRSNLLDVYRGKRRIILPISSALINEEQRMPPRKKQKTTSDNDGVKDKPKEKTRPRPRTSSSNNTKSNLMSTKHSNAQEVLQHEEFKRNRVMGMSNSIRKEALFRSMASVGQLFGLRLSVRLHRENTDDTVFVGPSLVEKRTADGHVVLDKEGKPQLERLLLGQRVCSKELDASCGINNNSHNSDVVNEYKMDTLNLKRLTKNTSSVGRNLIAIKRYADAANGDSAGGDVEEKMKYLEPIVIRGQGGVFTNAGANAPKTSADTTMRESPMHTLPSGQDLTSPNAQAWRKCLQLKQCINVYYQGYYLGLYYVTRIVEEERTMREVKEEIMKFNKVLEYLHDIDSKSFPSHINTDISAKNNSPYHEILGMLGMNQYITLTPVEPSIANGMERVDWKLLDMTCDDVIKPTVHIKNDALKSETDFSSKTSSAQNEPLLNWASLLAPIAGCSPLQHLKDEARKKCLGVDELKKSTLEVHGREIFGERRHNGKGRTFEEAMNAALHASGIITAKSTQSQCIVWDGNELKLNPPRFLLNDDEAYDDNLSKTRLKPLLMNPVHSPFISTEPPAMLAVAWTDSYNESLHDINSQSNTWIHRNGPAYCLNDNTKDEAWEIIFKAILCQLFTPSIFIYILYDESRGCGEMSSVSSTELINRLEEKNMVWKSSHIHKNLRKLFSNKDSFLGFIKWLSKNGGNAVRQAITNGRTRDGSYERTKIMTELANNFSKDSGVQFNEFSVQVLARCIECCIHEPFGDVISVHSGPGATEGGACFANAIKETKRNLTPPEWLVWKMNDRARQIIQEGNNYGSPVSKDQLQLELDVLGLDWSLAFDCLIHKYGIKKKLDSSDTEHLLCLINRLLQRTFPNQNTSDKHHHDTDWCLPVAFWNKDAPVIDMPFMRELVEASENTLSAYKQLLDDKTYTHKALSSIYDVDMYSN